MFTEEENFIILTTIEFEKINNLLDDIKSVLEDGHNNLTNIFKLNIYDGLKKHEVVKIAQTFNNYNISLKEIRANIKEKHELVLPFLTNNQIGKNYTKTRIKALTKSNELLYNLKSDINLCESYIFPESEFGPDSIEGCSYKNNNLNL